MVAASPRCVLSRPRKILAICEQIGLLQDRLFADSTAKKGLRSRGKIPRPNCGIRRIRGNQIYSTGSGFRLPCIPRVPQFLLFFAVITTNLLVWFFRQDSGRERSQRGGAATKPSCEGRPRITDHTDKNHLEQSIRSVSIREIHGQKSSRELTSKTHSAAEPQPSSADFQSAVSQDFILQGSHCSDVCEDTTPCRLEIGDTADWKSALRKILASREQVDG